MEKQRPLVKVIVLSKNEYDLIEPFLMFYGSLFGYDNIVVVDNGSTNERVLGVYEKYMNMGVTVKVDKRPFTHVAEIMTDYIRELKGTCEWICIMETDEFMFWTPTKDDPNAIVPQQSICDFLRSIPEHISILRYEAFYNCALDPADPGYEGHKYTCPPAQIHRFYDCDWDKIIVRSDKFDRVTQWSHHSAVTDGERVVVKELGLLHFHQTGAMRTFERSLQLIQGYNYFPTNLPIPMQIPICNRLVRYNVYSYHRVEYYRNVLVREWIIESFQRLKGRNPTVQEMVEIETSAGSDTNAIVQQVIDAATFPRGDIKEDIHDLVFYEPRKDHQFHIHQVKNYFKYVLGGYGSALL